GRVRMLDATKVNRLLSTVATAATALLLSFGLIHAQGTATSTASPATLPRIAANPNLAPAGELRDGVLTIRLEIREGEWYPEAETGPAVAVQAFAEEGRPLQIPGPLIRVPEGTEVRATVRNTLAKGTARLYGLHARPGGDKKPLEIPAGETRAVRFKLTAPGTYHYWATTTDAVLQRRFFADTQLSGALIADPPGEVVADRVFVIGVWLDPGVRGPSPRNGQSLAVINGKSWPHTERLTYKAGEPVRWRWINSSYEAHPMHLHGAYFRVRSEGDGDVAVALPN